MYRVPTGCVHGEDTAVRLSVYGYLRLIPCTMYTAESCTVYTVASTAWSAGVLPIRDSSTTVPLGSALGWRTAGTSRTCAGCACGSAACWLGPRPVGVARDKYLFGPPTVKTVVDTGYDTHIHIRDTAVAAPNIELYRTMVQLPYSAAVYRLHARSSVVSRRSSTFTLTCSGRLSALINK